MRRGLAAVLILLLAPALVMAAPAIKPGPTSKVYGPVFGTSGGDEPYLVGLSPRAGGGTIAAFVTSENLTDTPPGNFIGRPLDGNGVPTGPGVVWTRRNSNLQSAFAALNSDGTAGLAIWDEWEDGEGQDYGPVFVRRFDAATAEPQEEPRRIIRGTYLSGMAPLGDGYVVLHEPGGGDELMVQRVDGEGTPTGEPMVVDLYAPDLFESADRQHVALIGGGTASSSRTKVAILGADGVIAATRKLEAVKYYDLLDVAAAPGGGWLLLADVKRRLEVRHLSEEGQLGEATSIGTRNDEFNGYELALSDTRGLVAGYIGERCRGGFGAIALDATGKPLSRKATKLSRPPACKTAYISDSYLASAGGRDFVLGWTHSNGRKGHRVYATGIRR